MTTLSTIQANVTPETLQSSPSKLDRLLDWLEHVVDAFCGPAVGEASRENPAEAYLFLSPGCCGAVIDTKLWDLLTKQKPQPETEEVSNA